MRIRSFSGCRPIRRLASLMLTACFVGGLPALAASCHQEPAARLPISPAAQGSTGATPAHLSSKRPFSGAGAGAASTPDSSTNAAPSSPTQYECRWTDAPITIDGRDDEPAWKQAQAIDHFVISWKKGAARKPHTSTKAKLLWDREYLYFFAEMQDTDLYADITEHNGAIWNNDAFELFFKPADDKPGYYEFEVNPANADMELFLPARNAGGYSRFKGQTKIAMKTAVQLRGTLNHWQDEDQGWSVEGRIPWRDLAPTGGRPNVGEEWKFSLCRVDFSVGLDSPELSTCAPLTQPSFHRYEDYATLKFVRSDAGGPATAPAAQGARPYGIDRRVPWTTSRVIGLPDPPLPYTVEKAFPKLKVFQPLYVLEEPRRNDYLLLQHLGSWSGPGRLLRFRNDPNVQTTQTLLEIDGIAYGMTLHPDFVHNGYLYIMGNVPLNGNDKKDRITRYTISRQAPYNIEAHSELTILEWPSNGHNGGDLAFGPDGYLYHASGDGTSDSDSNLRGQDLTHLTAKMIRIDVDHPAGGKAYSVPRDNPFVNTPGARPETWAYGLRNPWRLAFDRKTGDLWVGQNGQDLWESVYLIHKGANYGWSRYEGGHEFQPLRHAGPTPVTFPIVEHPHSEMRSLTGGIVYRGSKFLDLDGAFIYGDWSTGRIWGVKSADHKAATWHKELTRTTLQIAGFRETRDGDILIMDQGGAAIYKLAPAPAAAPTSPFPRKLSETGLFVSTAYNLPSPALIPYDVNAPLWSDGAAKERFMAIPGEGTINVSAARGWDFSEGTVLVKTFSLDMELGNSASAKRLETRLFTKQMGQWAGYTYLWNDEQTDATLIGAAGLDKTYSIRDPAAPGGTRKLVWHFPSRAECMTCHSRASNFVLGPSILQLNKTHDYGNGIKDNQLRTLEHLGILRVDYMTFAREQIRKDLLQPGKDDREADRLMNEALATRGQREPTPSTLLAFDPDHIPRLTNPYDASADLTLRVRSYLHANCAICHVQEGGGNALMNLEFGVPPEKCRAINVPPQHDSFGIANAKLIAPGDPGNSVLLHRVAIRGSGQMPPLGSNMVDEKAVEMLRAWIEKMPPEQARLNTQ